MITTELDTMILDWLVYESQKWQVPSRDWRRDTMVLAQVRDKDGHVRGCGVRSTIRLQDQIICVHAEHMALDQADGFTEGSTLYVTMEPCRERLTDPKWMPMTACVDLICRAGIARVVYRETDERLGGAQLLIESGIEVVTA